jgi:ubiquinone/menaquinone biosynthesis C-methylase UbiE
MNEPKLNIKNYYQQIKNLNIEHYAGEVPYYSNADLRPAELKYFSMLKAGSFLLDLGCGSGRFSIGAAKHGFQVTGVDITPAAIEACKQRAKKEDLSNTKFLVGDMTKLDFVNESFDYVFCPRFVINAVSTQEMRAKSVQEMTRVVKNNNPVFIESFNLFYLGKGPFLFIKNLTSYFYRSIKLTIKKENYTGLLPGDIVYKANKVEEASIGYAHLCTPKELRSLVPKGRRFRTKSIHEIITGKKDWLKNFRYSIWLEINPDNS